MATVRLRNTNPLGAVDLPLIGRQDGTGQHAGEEGVGALEPGEIFEVDAELAGKAPFWRPLTEEDGVTQHDAAGLLGARVVDDQVEVLDPGSGLLAQVGNYELADKPAKKAAKSRSTTSPDTSKEA